MRIILFFLFLITTVICKNIFAITQSPTPSDTPVNNIFISEVMMDPPVGEYEWVEIYNSSDFSISLSNWYIDDIENAGSAPKSFSLTIAANQYAVVELSSSMFNNDGDTVRILDQNKVEKDVVSYLVSIKGKTLSRHSFETQEYCIQDATKNAQNIPCPRPTSTPTSTPAITPTLTPINTNSPTSTHTPTTTPSPSQTPTPSPTNSPTPSISSYNNVYLSEVMIDPPTGEKEWVELYNANNYDIALTNWYIDDAENAGSSPKTFSLYIKALLYGFIDLSSATFNNDGDSVRLLDAGKNQKDSFEYQGSQKGKTYGRISIESDTFCIQEPSKNTLNNGCLEQPTEKQPTPTTGKTPSSTSTPTTKPVKITYSPYSPTSSSFYTQKNNARSVSYKTLQSETTAQILGTQTNTHSTPLLDSLLLISSSYSLLTIASVFLKIINYA